MEEELMLMREIGTYLHIHLKKLSSCYVCFHARKNHDDEDIHCFSSQELLFLIHFALNNATRWVPTYSLSPFNIPILQFWNLRLQAFK